MMARLAATAPVATRYGDTLWMSLEGPIGERDPKTGKGIFAAPIEAALKAHSNAQFIEVAIDSAGGAVDEAMKIHGALRAARGFVTVTAGQQCASAASLILMAGDLRLALPKSRILLHGVEIEAPPTAERKRWTAEKYSQFARHIEKTDKAIVDLYAKRGFFGRQWFERELKNEDPLPLVTAQAAGIIHCLAGQESRHARTHSGRR
ncbi:ATP-dependent Clp protease proteolytic subunit [Mesorhizobium sp. M8A.F.Ca.ET.207.01.1.1]|uniref:ATP-dependent Clp protease proteolytic subunit n=1 Tax=Mesorhizobium sp. M8A.F.Ca.ET.207.01.1.1 TaxID=2563968 RepID=UPI001672F14E|nr:ATP-dependent Clp protease proteolytic subunit [Mesorhizobium sp. M8A.F.Ca.ET.207.01.1.1]